MTTSGLLVVDASVAASWAFEDETVDLTKSSFAVLDAYETIAPAHWPLELANALLIAERRGRVSSTYVAQFLSELHRAEIRIDSQTPDAAWAETLSLARKHRLTAYDAAYLELALRRQCPLVTNDRALAAAAGKESVALIE